MLNLLKVMALSFEKEKLVSEMLGPKDKNASMGLLKALLKRIDGLIKNNDENINEEIASEIIIASMLYISAEAGESASEDNLNTMVSNFLSGAMLGFDIPEGLE